MTGGTPVGFNVGTAAGEAGSTLPGIDLVRLLSFVRPVADVVTLNKHATFTSVHLALFRLWYGSQRQPVRPVEMLFLLNRLLHLERTSMCMV